MSGAMAAERGAAREPRRRRAVVGEVVVVTLAAALPAALLISHGRPSVLDRLEVHNDTRFEVALDARGPDKGWTPVTVLAPGQRVVLTDVLDHGATWTFHATGHGHDGGTFTVERTTLAANGWTVVVGGDVDGRLSADGARPVPPR